MIKRLELTWIHETSDESIGKYVQNKIGRLDKFIPRRDRGAVHVKVCLKKVKAADNRRYICEIILYLPGGIVLKTEEASLNTYAAIDISESKLKAQLLKHRQQHSNPRIYHKILSKFNRAG